MNRSTSSRAWEALLLACFSQAPEHHFASTRMPSRLLLQGALAQMRGGAPIKSRRPCATGRW